jgi:hypothetical protein
MGATDRGVMNRSTPLTPDSSPTRLALDMSIDGPISAAWVADGMMRSRPK